MQKKRHLILYYIMQSQILDFASAKLHDVYEMYIRRKK